MNIHAPSEPMTPDALEAALRAIGPKRYHDLHPFHGLLHDGKLNKGQVQAWALNRFVYQAAIPRKDASLIGRCEDRELRREWLHRITDHDGVGDEQGGIDRWLILTDGLGLDRDYVVSQEGALPATKFAVEAYVRFVRERPLIEAVKLGAACGAANALGGGAERSAGLLQPQPGDPRQNQRSGEKFGAASNLCVGQPSVAGAALSLELSDAEVGPRDSRSR